MRLPGGNLKVTLRVVALALVLVVDDGASGLGAFASTRFDSMLVLLGSLAGGTDRHLGIACVLALG